MINPEKEIAIDVDGIYWAMSLNGVNIPFERKIAIQSISIDTTCKGSDAMTVLIADPDMEFIQDDIYLEDTPISVDMNFHGSTEKASFYGYISEIEIDFPEMGSPTIELYCLDKTHLMQRVKNTQTWDNARSIDVVKEKINGYGFKLVYQEDYEYILEESISQSGQTDIEFLESLANNERELFIAKLVGDTFFYIRLGLLAEPTFNLYYRYDALRNNVKSFKPTIDKETRKVDVRYADIKTTTKDVDSHFANLVTVALQTQGYPIDVSGVLYGSTPYDDTPLRKQKEENDEAYQDALSVISQKAAERGKTGSGSEESYSAPKSKDKNKTEREFRDIEYNTLRGEADLMPTAQTIGLKYMTTVYFDGLGKYLSGLYFVEGVKRTLDGSSGYTQSITLIKTGFGDAVKTPTATVDTADAIELFDTSIQYKVGDTIKITNEVAEYVHAHTGVRIPQWVIDTTHVVAEVDANGKCLRLDDINSWVKMDDVGKV